MGLMLTAIDFPLLRTAVGMVKPGVECFLGDAEALQSWGQLSQPPARPLSHASQVSRLIDNQKQNKSASLPNSVTASTKHNLMNN